MPKTRKDGILMEQNQKRPQDEAATLLALAATRKAKEQKTQPSPAPPAPADSFVYAGQPVDAPLPKRDKRFQIALVALSVVLALSIATNLYQWWASIQISQNAGNLTAQIDYLNSVIDVKTNDVGAAYARVQALLTENSNLSFALDIYQYNIALLNDEYGYYQQYHTYECKQLNRKNHYVTSTDYAKDVLGCTPCPLCHSMN